MHHGIKHGLCAFVVLLSVLQLVYSNTCVLRPFKYCTNQCSQNTSTCLCEAVMDGVIENCLQYCDYPHTQICPDMVCRGGKTCRQFCGKASCNMTCSKNAEYCHQNCTSPGKCDLLKCSSAKCVQVCSNCTMVCTEEVDDCEQTCLGGACNLKCQARNCRNACDNGNKTQCDITEPVNGDGCVIKGSLMSLLTFIIIAICFFNAS